LNDIFFFSAPQLKRDPLGCAIRFNDESVCQSGQLSAVAFLPQEANVDLPVIW
jgi:hypothetical protein